MAEPELELVWDGGSLDLMGENETPYGPVEFAALADGTEWGKPESVRRALFSLLADGSASVTDRYDNRTVTVKLRLSAADGAALAGGEAPLHMLAGMRRAELRWTPPSDFAAPAAYIIVASDLSHDMDDLAENRIERFYTLTLVALPFALSTTETVIEAQPPFVATPATLVEPTSTTGWFGAARTGVTPTASIAYSSGVVTGAVNTFSAGPSLHTFTARYTPSSAINMTASFLAIKGAKVPQKVLAAATAAPTTSLPAAVELKLVGREGEYSFYEAPANPHIEEFVFQQVGPAVPAAALFSIDLIAQSSAPAVSAGRQSLRYIDVAGSARAASTVTVESRTADPLNEVVVFTGAEYDPRLSIGRQEAGTANGFTLSGRLAETLTSFTFFRNASEFPTGSYTFWANPIRSGAGGPEAVNWTIDVDLVPASSTTKIADLADLTATTPGGAAAKRLRLMGALDLPGVDLPAGSSHRVRFVLTSSVAVNWDEGLLFDRSGSLSILDLNTPASTKAWLESAALDHAPRSLHGSGDLSLALPASLASMVPSWSGGHAVSPGRASIYIATTGVADPKVTSTFRSAWHTHPAK